MASFEILRALADIEQIIYFVHYDKNKVEGNPRKGWVKIGLIVDLSPLINTSVETKALNLKETWSSNWDKIKNEQGAVTKIIDGVDFVRKEIKQALNNLK